MTPSDSFEVEIMLPDSKLAEIAEGDAFGGRAVEIIFPGLDGMIGVRPGHAPMLAGLDIGDLLVVEKVGNGTRDLHFAVGSGIVEVELDGSVAIYTSAAEYACAIDLERAEDAIKRAKERLSVQDDMIDKRRAEIALKRAINRLNIAKKYGGGKF